jgi:hypothetical protein
MPIEQSPRFYMAVNLKTAASLGVSLSDVFIEPAPKEPVRIPEKVPESC